MKINTIIFTILFLAFGTPAFGQGLLELYPNNMGYVPHNPYGFVCKVGTEKDQDINFKKKQNRCENDEAKSMVLTGFFKKGTRIFLYDNPDGKRSDDWFEIEFKDDMVNVRYVIPSFELSFKDRFIWATYHKKNGLNGKVSRMEIRIPH
jgi:hypothetical protein